ncbi:metacaspase-1 [Gammaproteobacteria bacterium]
MNLNSRNPVGRGGWIAALLFLLLASPPGWAERHALLIGVSNYSASGAQGLHDLPGTKNDIDLIYSVLEGERYQFKRNNITTLRDAEATHDKVEQAFAALAQRVQPGDSVYVHYSGHGSYTPDPTGRKRNGQHETWVSYGARVPGGKGRDQYDILDNELNLWLKPIDEKIQETGELVYVSDSCFAGSNARGNALVTRAEPPQKIEDPKSKEEYDSHIFHHAVLIYAARDDQSANEFKTDDQKPYGVFTWQWAQAMQKVEPGAGETWQQVFTRAEAGVARIFGRSQQPQIDGPYKNHAVLGGKVSAQPDVMVMEIGTRVILNAGRISGVTPGSRYRGQQGEPPAELEISQAFATWSEANVTRGKVQPGAFLVETEHAYVSAP